VYRIGLLVFVGKVIGKVNDGTIGYHMVSLWKHNQKWRINQSDRSTFFLIFGFEFNYFQFFLNRGVICQDFDFDGRKDVIGYIKENTKHMDIVKRFVAVPVLNDKYARNDEEIIERSKLSF